MKYASHPPESQKCRWPNKLLLIPILLLSLAMKSQDASGWSSYSILDENKTPLGTHQRFNYLAYEKLGRHPILGPEAINSRGQRIVNFPTLEAIQAQTWISRTGSGPGPDVKGNSLYSEHYFNPRLNEGKGEGGAPVAVRKHFQNLQAGLRNEYLIRKKKVAPGDLAKNAAYGAHFIQDMTCPFHVLGAPRQELANWETSQPGKKVLGPYGGFLDERWKNLMIFARADAKSADADWMEANYYDGFEFRNFSFPFFRATTLVSMDAIVLSTHFYYEAEIEAVCYFDPLCRDERKWVRQWEQEDGWNSPHWKGLHGLEDFAKSLATETRDRLDAAGSKLAFNRHKIIISIPYEQWWRAVQATYTLWRASFSALFVDLDDLELRKVPNEPETYQLWVRVHNYELETAANVKLDYQISGGKKAAGSATLGNIERWTQLRGQQHTYHTFTHNKIRIKNPRDQAEMDGIVRVAVSGKFNNVHDPGAVFEYSLRDIPVDAIQMIKLEGGALTVEDALNTLKGRGLKRENIRIRGKYASGEKVTIASQNPRPGTWISRNETITLFLEEQSPPPRPTPKPGPPEEPSGKADCRRLREEYSRKFAAMVDKYQKRSCKIARFSSGCAQNVAGFVGAYIADAFSDTHCNVPGYVACGKAYLEKYYACLCACNEGWQTRITTQGALRRCQAGCNETAGAAKKACVAAAKKLR